MKHTPDTVGQGKRRKENEEKKEQNETNKQTNPPEAKVRKKET
jgi:hypothetical protein